MNLLSDDDRIELERVLPLNDPGDLLEVIDAEVGGSSPTNDPNRLTMHVPTEHTSLSLGAACSKEGFHIDDPGLTGRSDRHIHLHVTGEDHAKETLVRLGTPSTDAASIWDNMVGDDTGALWPGYAMVSKGHALQESLFDHHIHSRTGSVRVEAFGDDAELRGAKNASVWGRHTVTITANDDDLNDWRNKEAWSASNWGNKLGRFVGETFDWISSGLVIVNGFIGVGLALYAKRTESQFGFTGFTPFKFGSWKAAQQAIVAGLLTARVAALTLDNLNAGEGDVTLEASNRVLLRGDTAIHLYGGNTTTVDGLLATTVSSPVSTMVQGGLFMMATGGIMAALRGYVNANVVADLGEATVHGAKRAELSSQAGPAVVTGMFGAQLNAIAGSTFVHSPLHSALLAGQGAGFGVIATNTSLTMASLALSPNLRSATPTTKKITIDNVAITAVADGATLQLNPAATRLANAGAMVQLATGGLTICQGTKVLLG